MHVILLCFSVVKPQSLWNLKRHWLPEITQKVELNLGLANKKYKGSSKRCTQKQARSGPAIILVGCKCDLRSDISYILELAKQNEEPIDERIAKCLASELGAEVYIECSSLTQKLLKKVFDLAIWLGMKAYRSVNANSTGNNRSLAVSNSSSNHHVGLSTSGTMRNGNIPCSSKRQHKVAESSSSEVNSKCHCL
ncbi:hypothetical protein Ciccas_005060 [Cichlidogyrus casuarinus]|uniref:Uncharacterized protein n=1 Tax=Cichlidogyrus casuarinus TaxID=1844966 RepID=A0ABD2Q9R1_9PLAT